MDHVPSMIAEGNRLLVVGIAAFTLGLGATLAGLAPLPEVRDGDRGSESPLAITRGVAARAYSSPDLPTLPSPGTAAPEMLPHAAAAGRARLVSQLPFDTTRAGITSMDSAAWTSLQHDSPGDRRVHLIEAALLIHAPAIGRQATPPHPHGVD